MVPRAVVAANIPATLPGPVLTKVVGVEGVVAVGGGVTLGGVVGLNATRC